MTALAGDKRCELSWQRSAEGDPTIKYTGYISKTSDVSISGKEFQGCSGLDSDLNCVSENLLNGQTYHYMIKAENEGGEAFSERVTCKPGEAPGEIKLNITAKDGACDFSWDKPTGADPLEYTVEMSEIGDPFDATDSIAKCNEISAQNCSVTGLNNNQVYTFAAIAWNEFGDSGESDAMKCMPVAAPDCSFNGTVVASGTIVKAYKEDLTITSCVSEDRECINSSLTGTYQYAACDKDTSNPVEDPPNNEP